MKDSEIEDTLQYTYEVYMGKHPNLCHKDNWFFGFHKSIRQCDFFSGLKKETITDTRIEEEKEEHKKIGKELTDMIDALPEEIREAEDFRVRNYWREHCPEKWERNVLLNQKKRESEIEYIGGHVDMILWEAIHLDKDGILPEVMEKTFKEYFIESEDAKG